MFLKTITHNQLTQKQSNNFTPRATELAESLEVIIVMSGPLIVCLSCI